METPFGPLGYITYKRTYSRRIDDNKSEEFGQTIDRIIDASQRQLKCGFTGREEKRLREILLGLKGSVAGRFMWQLGTRTVKDLGLLSLQNCAFVTVDEPIRPFTWTMDCLMLGSGVGFNIQREYVYELPKVGRKIKIVRNDTNDADFIVSDSRQGWVELLRKTLEAHFFGGKGFSYSTVCVRGKGTPIRGFGGTASGPDSLCWGIAEISKLLNKRASKKLRPIDCLDIMNIIGYVVVSGNVRRSAQIAIGDYDDLQFLKAKNWSDGNIPNWRAMSNNSVVCNDIKDLPDIFWDNYLGGGEPLGLINLRNARLHGRTGDLEYPDPDVAGFNPCAEQSLAPYETCCLAEIHLPNIGSANELFEVATYLYRINKHSLALKCHHPETQKIVHQNMRMGIGITGYCMATKEQQSWLDKTYKRLRMYDASYSIKHGFPKSIKLTTIKPSGTLSLLSGVTPGAHPGFSQYHIRRIRIAANSPLVEVCKQHGYKTEFERKFDGTDNYETIVVEFPCKFPAHTTFASDVTAIDQLNVVTKLQREWSDNAVSVTVYYKKEELKGIKKWLKENYNEGLKSVSFLLHSEHGFDQAPLEEITKDQYYYMKEKTRPITNCNVREEDVKGIDECESGMCPIK